MSVSDQLQSIRTQLRDAQKGIVQLADDVSDAQWTTRPRSGGWSAAECIAHLTMTTESYLPKLHAAQGTIPVGAPLPSRYKKGVGGGLLAWFLEPPGRMKSKTIPAFIPEAAAPKARTIAAFTRSQGALLVWIDGVQNLALNHAIITSPFNEKLTYNAYSALNVMCAHQRRHLWQAERATRGIP